MLCDDATADRYRWLMLLIGYCVAYGGMLLEINSIFWDDWILWPADSQEILETFEQAGAFLNLTAYIHIALLSAGPWLYKVTTFVLFFVTAVLLERILKKHEFIDSGTRFLFLLFYLTAPLYAARITLIVGPYTIAWFCFVLGWWLIRRQRFLSLLMFAFSFNVQSLLVYYAVPIAEWYLRDNRSLAARDVLAWAVRRLDYMVLPFVWFLVKVWYFSPYGFYEGYNTHYSVYNLLDTPINQIRDLFGQSLNLPLFLLFFVISVVFFSQLRSLFGGNPCGKQLVVVGFLALLVGLFPYWILGLEPSFDGWSSRHQLLMPLGIALMVSGFLTSLPPKWALWVAGLLLAINLSKTTEIAWDFWKDSRKQSQIMEFLRGSDEIRFADLVIFNDETPNALSRRYRFYEWTGMMRAIFGDQTRFGLRTEELGRYTAGEYDRFFTAKYNAAGHQRMADNNAVTVNIRKGAEGIEFTTTSGKPEN